MAYWYITPFTFFKFSDLWLVISHNAKLMLLEKKSKRGGNGACTPMKEGRCQKVQSGQNGLDVGWRMIFEGWQKDRGKSKGIFTAVKQRGNRHQSTLRKTIETATKKWTVLWREEKQCRIIIIIIIKTDGQLHSESEGDHTYIISQDCFKNKIEEERIMV